MKPATRLSLLGGGGLQGGASRGIRSISENIQAYPPPKPSKAPKVVVVRSSGLGGLAALGAPWSRTDCGRREPSIPKILSFSMDRF